MSSDSESKFDAKDEKEKNDDEESTPKSAVKRKSPKKRMKQENVQPTEQKKTSEPLKMEGIQCFFVASSHYAFVSIESRPFFSFETSQSSGELYVICTCVSTAEDGNMDVAEDGKPVKQTESVVREVNISDSQYCMCLIFGSLMHLFMLFVG